MLKSLPLLPILVDYRTVAAFWTERVESLALAALRNRSRVRGIALGNLKPRDVTFLLLGPLSNPFPELESLEICPNYDFNYRGNLIFPATLLSGSASRMRRLTLRGGVLRCLSPLLLSATGLVELTLTLEVENSALPEASFIANLQRMSHLRRLELDVKGIPIRDGWRPPAATGEIVPLSNLMQLIFSGCTSYLEALLVVLAAPSLQHLDAELTRGTGASPTHLCRFICDTHNQFHMVRLDFSHWQLKFTAETRFKSINARTFRIIFPEPISLEEIGNGLSRLLSTVKELVIGEVYGAPQSILNTFQWCRFFAHFQQVKFVQVPSQVVLDVVLHLDGQEPPMDLLPALEQIKVHMTHHKRVPTGIREALKPLITARKQVGRPIGIRMSLT